MLKIAVYTLAFIVTQTCHAQDAVSIDRRSDVPYPKPFISKVELQVGPSLTFFRGDEFYRDHSDLKMGVAANIGFIHEFNSRVQVSAIFTYETKGSKNTTYSLNEDFTPPAEMKHISNVTLNYVTVSLLPRYSFLQNRRLFFAAGPYFGYIINTKVTSTLYLNGTLFARSGGRPDLSYDYEKYDYGLTTMIGFNIVFKEKQKASVQLMYKKGMMDINQPMVSQIRTNSISMLFSIRIK